MTTDQTAISFKEIMEHAAKPENWLPTVDVPEQFPQFTKSQLKRLFWQREKHSGLCRCYRQIGKKSYVNIPLFGLWCAGLLPEQQSTTDL